jgi:transposase-like protein
MEETLVTGASVARVARAHGVNTSLSDALQVSFIEA